MNENKRLYSIRGAVCAENTVEDITLQVGNMCNQLFSDNNLKAEDIVNIQFTMTPDLDVLNPATALRKSETVIATSGIPLFCSQEAVIKGMLNKVIRVMITCYMDCGSTVKPCYLNGAQALRPDLSRR